MLGGRKVAVFLGNSLFGDDGIALLVAAMLKEKLQSEGFEVHAVERTGFALLDYLEGYKDAIIIDSVGSGNVSPGHVQTYSLEDFKLVKQASPHFAGVPEALELMDTLHLRVPAVKIIGISIRDPYILSDTLSEELNTGINAIAGQVYEEIRTDAPDITHHSGTSA